MNTMNFKKSIVTRTLAFIMAIAVVLSFTSAHAESKVYSETQSYANPVSSGKVSYTYTDGMVTFSNEKVSNKKLTNKDVAAVNDATETAEAFDQYGTLWIKYRNGAIYWYNYDILGKMGIAVKWRGLSNSEDIKGTTLKFKGTTSYYATHYFSSLGVDKPLPTWLELYKLVNDKDYDTTTEAPTPATTTQVPTPTATTQQPASVTTQAPATTINTTFDIEWWWQRYLNGEITWEMLENILWKYNWTSQEVSKDTSTTYYFYDENGRLIKEVTESTGQKNETGTGVGQATATASGSATVKIAENGSGNANGVVNTTIDNSTTTIINGASGNAVVQDKKNYWATTRQGHKVKLWKTIIKTTNGKIETYPDNCSTAIFNEKKGVVKWNGITIKKVKKCQFIKKSHRLLIILKNGKAYSYANKSGDSSRKYLGKNIKTYKCVPDKYNKGLATALVKNGKKAKLINIVGK